MSESDETSGEDRPMKKKKIRTKREQQLGYYEGELKTIIILTKDLYKTYVLAVNAYPSHKQIIAATRECYEEASKQLYGKKYKRESQSLVLCNLSSLFPDMLSTYNDDIRALVRYPPSSSHLFLACVSLNSPPFR